MARLLKNKSQNEVLHLQVALSRLRDISKLVMLGCEPMLSIRLDALVNEVEQALQNSKEVKNV